MNRIVYKVVAFFESLYFDYKKQRLSNTFTGEINCLRASSNVINISNKKENINIGRNTLIDGSLLIFNYGGEIVIGEYSYIGEYSKIWSAEKVIIGNHVFISHNVNIIDTNSHEIDYQLRSDSFIKFLKDGQPKEKGSIKTAPIVIEDHAWISFNSIILKGVRIGKGAIVAAGSVVTKDVESFTIVGGNPARFLKKLDEKIL